MEFFPEILPVKTAQDTAQRPDAQIKPPYGMHKNHIHIGDIYYGL